MRKFDLILQRITSISQIALVIIAVFTIWYSVIPLYQKELASEQLAKIQIDQIAAEERVKFLDTSYTIQLQEIDNAHKEIAGLTTTLVDDRSRLDSLTAEISQKNNQLSNLNSSLNKAKVQAQAANTQLTQSQRLKFIQALEWYTLTAPLHEKCDQAMRRWTRADSTEQVKVKKTGCNPYENIKSAISNIQQPNAKDSSGDDLHIDQENMNMWCKRAYSLMEKNKYQLADQMNYAHRDQLLREAEKDKKQNLSSQELDKDIEQSLEAAKALIEYEYEIKKKNRDVVSWYIKLLRSEI
jgi:hypothetical protein